MQVKFIKPWSIYRTGTVIEMPGGAADMLIRRRFVREHTPPKPKKRPDHTKQGNSGS